MKITKLIILAELDTGGIHQVLTHPDQHDQLLRLLSAMQPEGRLRLLRDDLSRALKIDDDEENN